MSDDEKALWDWVFADAYVRCQNVGLAAGEANMALAARRAAYEE